MNYNQTFSWLIQLIGHSMDFSTIHLSSPGLYVNIPRFSTPLPATVSELETDVPTLLCSLLTFRPSSKNEFCLFTWKNEQQQHF
ncbi:hypothetical protein PS6_005312 [Mucor atramentarius]